jgi:chromate reductase
MKFLALSGSLRQDGYSTLLARSAVELAPDGVEVTLFDGLHSIPGFNQDLEPEGVPTPVEDLRRQIEEADALLVVTPEYNASVPGALKNAIDWASRPNGSSALMGKPAAIVSSSPSPFGGAWANQHVRKVFSITGTPVVETELAIGKADRKLSPEGKLVDPDTRGRMSSLLLELEELADQVSQAELEELAA